MALWWIGGLRSQVDPKCRMRSMSYSLLRVTMILFAAATRNYPSVVTVQFPPSTLLCVVAPLPLRACYMATVELLQSCCKNQFVCRESYLQYWAERRRKACISPSKSARTTLTIVNIHSVVYQECEPISQSKLSVGVLQ